MAKSERFYRGDKYLLHMRDKFDKRQAAKGDTRADKNRPLIERTRHLPKVPPS